MTPTMRKALYGLIPLVVAALTAYGIFTDNLGVLWGNVATLTVGFAFAASRATGDRFGDPEVRRALYVLVPAVVALIGGYFSVDVALWTSLAMAILGAALAWRNVDPDEQKAADYQHKRLEWRVMAISSWFRRRGPGAGAAMPALVKYDNGATAADRRQWQLEPPGGPVPEGLRRDD